MKPGNMMRAFLLLVTALAGTIEVASSIQHEANSTTELAMNDASPTGTHVSSTNAAYPSPVSPGPRKIAKTFHSTQILTSGGASARYDGISSHYQRLATTAQTFDTSTLMRQFLGSGSVSSCYSALWEWYSTSSSSAIVGGYYSISITTWSAHSVTVAPPDYYFTDGNLTSIKTFCDGYLRGLGTPNYLGATPLTTTEDHSSSITTLLTVPGHTPAPCAISPLDCTSLWSQYSALAATGKQGYKAWQSVMPPPCYTTGSVIPFERNKCLMDGALYVDGAKLIYWPIRLANNSSPIFKNGTEALSCPISPLKQFSNGTWIRPATISEPRTAEGANTYVHGNITITSPSIGIELFNIRRTVPGCGPVVNTVVKVAPEHLSSALGNDGPQTGRARPFNLDDLNWICANTKNPDGPWITQDVQGSGCHQNVPATAYFSGAYFWPRYTEAMSPMPGPTYPLTIANDYFPVLTMGGEPDADLKSIFGQQASWLAAGIRDPPVVVSVTNRLLPVTTDTTDIDDGIARITNHRTLPSPGQTLSLSTTLSTTSEWTRQTIILAAQSSQRPDIQVEDVLATQKPSAAVASPLPIVNIAPGVVNVDNVTLIAGEPEKILSNGQRATFGPDGVIIGSGPSKMTIPVAATLLHSITLAASTVSFSKLAQDLVILGDQTLAVGGPAKTVGAQLISLVPSGVVIGSGSTASTITLSVAAITDVVTIGDYRYVRRISPAGVQVLADSHTTLTLIPGGSAGFLAGHHVSAQGTALVVSGSSGAATTFGTNLVTIGAEVWTISKLPSGDNVLANCRTEITLDPNGSALTMGGHTIGPATGGLVIVKSGSTSTKALLSPSSRTSDVNASASMLIGNQQTGAAASGHHWSLLSFTVALAFACLVMK